MDDVFQSVTFHSPIGTYLAAFLAEHRARGHRYTREEHRIHEFDRFLQAEGLAVVELPKHLVETWIASRPGERPGTQRMRLNFVRKLATYLDRKGCPAYIVPRTRPAKLHVPFAPRIFSHEEIRALLDAADRTPYCRCSRLRHVVVPEFFRVLYGCGLRVGEATRLTVADVDLDRDLLRIREGKSRRDRVVPMAPALGERLRRYAARIGPRGSKEIFFPSPRGGSYRLVTVYKVFRGLLLECGIAHHGRGRGPRLHEIRHSFAVHRLELWYRQGVDLRAKLPLLATYMGHRSLAGTQAYLQLTQAIFTEVAARSDAKFGHVIPRRTRS